MRRRTTECVEDDSADERVDKVDRRDESVVDAHELMIDRGEAGGSGTAREAYSDSQSREKFCNESLAKLSADTARGCTEKRSSSSPSVEIAAAGDFPQGSIHNEGTADD